MPVTDSAPTVRFKGDLQIPYKGFNCTEWPEWDRSDKVVWSD